MVATTVTNAKPVDWNCAADPEGERDIAQIVLEDNQCQSLMDTLQTLFIGREDWRLVLTDVEAVLPRVEAEPDETEGAEDKKKPAAQAVREALFEEVMGNSRITGDFLLLTMLSAIVAAIGLNEDNVAVVIGAMVIAPLLGPVLAFGLAAALGSGKFMLQAARTAGVGLAAGIGTVFLLSLVMPINLDSQELVARTDISAEIVALALASGAAAALSTTGGLSASLVGVMVAVALLPPSAAAAIYLGAGEVRSALAALIVVALNITCVLISTQMVFALKGVRPRRWIQQKNAARSLRLNLIVWACLLVALFTLGLWVTSSGEFGS